MRWFANQFVLLLAICATSNEIKECSKCIEARRGWCFKPAGKTLLIFELNGTVRLLSLAQAAVSLFRHVGLTMIRTELFARRKTENGSLHLKGTFPIYTHAQQMSHHVLYSCPGTPTHFTCEQCLEHNRRWCDSPSKCAATLVVV